MGTKTVTIMEDVYGLLLSHKLADESFSDELRRVFSKRKSRNLNDYFGILADTEGEDILKMLEQKRAAHKKMSTAKRRII